MTPALHHSDVLAAIARVWDVPAVELTGRRSKERPVVEARWAAAYVLTEWAGWTDDQAARVLAKRPETIAAWRQRLAANAKHALTAARLARVRAALRLRGPARSRVPVDAIRRLRGKGFSVAGIAKHLDQPPAVVAKALGLEWGAS